MTLALYTLSFFFFNDTATTEIYTLSLHDALPILALMAVAMCGGAVLSGCTGFATSNGNPTPLATVQISPAAITFSNVATGQKATQTATLTNTGQESVTVSGLSGTSSQFAASVSATPMELAPGQSANFQVAFVSNTAVRQSSPAFTA